MADMIARSGVHLSPLIRASAIPATKVADLVVRTIRTGRSEVFAAPGGSVMARHPRLASKTMRAMGMVDFMNAVAESDSRTAVR
jgi:hypothetical protein